MLGWAPCTAFPLNARCEIGRPPFVNVSASTPGPATSAVSDAGLDAWQMRTNYIEYHLRLQEHRPKQGKLFSEEYPEPSVPAGNLESTEPSIEHSYSSFGSEHDLAQAAVSSSHTTSVAQTIFNVVRCLTCAVICYIIKWPQSMTRYGAG